MLTRHEISRLYFDTQLQLKKLVRLSQDGVNRQYIIDHVRGKRDAYKIVLELD